MNYNLNIVVTREELNILLKSVNVYHIYTSVIEGIEDEDLTTHDLQRKIMSNIRID